MRILVLSDEECPGLWDYYRPGKLDGYDLIISCGDLKSKYLQFIVTMAHCPVLYVPGNHDTHYVEDPPEGCDCIDEKLVEFNGYRFVGFGGCRRYHPGRYQYSDSEMRKRISRLRFLLWRTKGVDIVVTHAPPEGLGDGQDNAHRGFAAFVELLEKYHPMYFLHGHVHTRYDAQAERVREYQGTTLINCCERYELELPDRPVKPKKWGQVIWISPEPKYKKEAWEI